MLPSFLVTISLLLTLSSANIPAIAIPATHILGGMHFSLRDRYANTFVNDVFSDNILLTLAYMRGIVKDGTVNWDDVKRPFSYQFTLLPGQVFAFHDNVLPQFEGKVVKTTNAHFGSQEGFKSDGWLVADGVCHIASLINEAANNAGLMVEAPTNHDFAPIPEIDKKYGTAIYFMPGEKGTNELQNLYVENNKEKPVTFNFVYNNDKLDVFVSENTN